MSLTIPQRQSNPVSSDSLLSVENLTFSYQDSADRPTLSELNLRVNRGEWVAIQGSSGSGKSTLFFIIAGLLKTRFGFVKLEGVDLGRLSNHDLSELRNRRIGFVFQQFHLLPKTSILENILLPTRYPMESAQIHEKDVEKAREMATRVGVGGLLDRTPNQLSGGQQQRVAICRALIRDADLILADEPTGNLDSTSATQIMELFEELHASGKTIIMITHDPEIAKSAERVIQLKDGQIISDRVQQRKMQSSVQGQFSGSQFKKSKESPVQLRVFTQLKALLPLVFRQLLAHRSKSFLTMLGVIIGVAAVIAMVTLGRFVEHKIVESYEKMGSNRVSVRAYENWRARRRSSGFDGFDAKRDFPSLMRLFPVIQYLSPVLPVYGDSKVIGGSTVVGENVSVIGVNEAYAPMTLRRVRIGRGMSIVDVDSNIAVCVLGWELAQALHGAEMSVGQWIQITDESRVSFLCRVIGVYESLKSSRARTPPNWEVHLPYTTFQKIAPYYMAEIREVSLQMKSGTDMEVAGKGIKNYLSQKWEGRAQVSVDSESVMVAQMKRFLGLFTILLSAIAFLSLVVGGIGINNMILVSLAERFREFGLRKALGATDRSIRYQVLLESGVLCGVAGLLGVVLGVVGYQGLIYAATFFVKDLQFEWVMDPLAMLIAFGSIVGVGILSGLTPAVKAEKLQVMDALRRE